MEKKRMKKITWRWLVNSFGVVLLIVVVMVIAIAVSVHSYYYNGARQFLLSRSDSVATPQYWGEETGGEIIYLHNISNLLSLWFPNAGL